MFVSFEFRSFHISETFVVSLRAPLGRALGFAALAACVRECGAY